MDPPAHYVESMLPARVPPARTAEPISVGLNAAILAVRGDEPMVAVVPASRREREGDGALPCGSVNGHGELIRRGRHEPEFCRIKRGIARN